MVNGRIGRLGCGVVREAQNVAAADAGQPAGAGDEQEPRGAHAADQVRIGAFARTRCGCEGEGNSTYSVA